MPFAAVITPLSFRELGIVELRLNGDGVRVGMLESGDVIDGHGIIIAFERFIIGVGGVLLLMIVFASFSIIRVCWSCLEPARK